jgi:uncharacterized repeat protein (TIGR01451 family)
VTTRAFLTRTFGALLFALVAATGIADAGSPITVNKAFNPTSVGLGGKSQVTVELQNTSTNAGGAAITKFQDNLDSTGGVAIVDTLPADAPTTTCGGAVSITGGDNNTITMAGGTIPAAVGATPGACTVTFYVFGDQVGSSTNAIHGDAPGPPDVTTALGDPPLDIFQQFTVGGSAVSVAAGPSDVAYYTATGQVTFTITNPASTIPLTNVGFAINGNGNFPYTIAGATTLSSGGGSCGGTIVTTPGATTTGGFSISGATIPAGGTCTVTLDVTDPTALPNLPIVNFTLPAGSVTNTQLATNTAGVSNQISFTTGSPIIGKTFSNPKYVLPGGTNLVTLTVRNVLTSQALTGAQLIDPLSSAGLTLDPAATIQNANGNCGAPTLTGQGTGTATVSGMTIPPLATCSLQILADIPAVVTPGSYTNTIPPTDFSATGPVITTASNQAQDSLTVTGGGGGLITNKTVSVGGNGTVPPNTPFRYTVSFTSVPSGAFSAGQFTDALPQQPGLPLVALNDATHLPTSVGCGAPTFNVTTGATSVGATGMTIASGGTCSVSFYVQFTGIPQGSITQFTNTLQSANVSFKDASLNTVNPINSPSVSVFELPIITLQNYLASGQNLTGQPITVRGQIVDSTGVADTNVVATFPLNPGQVHLQGTGNFVFDPSCPTGANAPVVTPGTAGESFTITVPAISASCMFTYSVIDEGTSPTYVTGTYTPGNSTYVSGLTGGLTSAPFTGTNNVTFSTTNINISKVFSPNQIQAGGISTVQVTTSVAGLTAPFTQTQANGVSFTDPLPASVSFAPNPNVTYGGGCQQAGQPAPTSAIAGTSITFSNISLLTIGTTPTNCVVSFDVTSSTTPLAPFNSIPAHTVTSTAGITNSIAGQASLTVNAGIALQKTFSPASFSIGSVDYVRFLITNTVSSSILTGGTLVDNMPVSLLLASTTFGPTQPGDPASCGGAITPADVGTSTFHLTGLTVGAATGTNPIVPATCVAYVPVKVAPNVAPGGISNTVAAGQLAIGGQVNQLPTTGTTTATNAPAVTLGKSFTPTTIPSGGTSVLTLTIANTSANAAPLTALAVTDGPFPAGVTVAATPNASTTCTGGTPTAVAGGTSVALTGGTLAANATCTVSVSVTGTAAGIYTNTVPAGAVTSTQGATNTAPASAVLNIGNVSGVTLAKSFAPALIAANGTSTLTVTIANTQAGSLPLSSIALIDTLPANVVIAPVPAAATTCTAGTVSAAPGGTSVSISGASMLAGSTCTFSVSVTSAVAGIYPNLIPPGALSDAQGSTNAAPATATLNVGNTSGVGLAKSFSPNAIPANGTSALTIEVFNTGTGAVALTAMGLTDTLPTNVKVAPTPGASTTCAPGTVTALPGATSVTLAGGGVAANAACTITVNVTSAVAGVFTNTIPANALTDAQASTNDLPASAILNVANASGVSVTKAFAPGVIAPGATSVLTISLANTAANAVALTALNLVDNLPANITIAATPNASTTCVGGTVTATAGATNVSLSGASMAINNQCTITLTVTGTIPGTYVNTIPAGGVSTAQGATNSNPAQGTLIVGQPALLVTKTSTPSGSSVSPGQTVTYTIVIKNNGTQAETNAHVTDTLANAALVPGSVTVNGSGVADQVITSGQSFGSIAVGATVTISYAATVNIGAATGAIVSNTATVAGDQPCTIGQCTSTSPPNAVSPPILTASKLIDGQQSEPVLAGQTVTYSITIANTGSTPAINTSVTDVVPNGITVLPGTVTLNSAPLPSATLAGQTLTIPIGTLAAQASAIAAFNAKMGVNAGTSSNTASVTAAGVARAVVSNAAVSHQVPATIAVTKTASATTASTGDRVDYQIVVAPTGGIAYGAAIIDDTLPPGEIYAPGTARVNGKPLNPTVSGNTLIWTLPALVTPATFTYSTVIAPGVPNNTQLTNTVNVTAVAPGGAGVGRGSGSASVLVVQSTFGSCYPITGRVYLDTRGRGHFEDPDVGLGGVHIYMDDGESVTTDEHGRYDFPCVHPGMHALRLDETTLPPGAVPYDDRNIDSEKSTRRLVHHIYDTTIIEDINFAVSGKLSGSPAPPPDCCSGKGPPPH